VRHDREHEEGPSMQTRFLGDTGLKVSTLALGTMGFGGGRASPVGDIELDDARRMVAMSIDAGVNLFDTADSYGRGRAEELLGAALGTRRDDVLVSTKLHARSGDGPNDVGQSRWHIERACEASLRRLGRDHIDILHVHGHDGCTAPDESLGALDRLVRAGKVRYLACSNHTGWQIARAIEVSRQRNLDRFVAVQAYYSLVGRDFELDIQQVCEAYALGVLVWSPLAGGLLSGKFDRDHTPEGTRRSAVGDLGVGPVDRERSWRVIDACATVAAARGVSVAQVALNWVRANHTVSSVIVGARTTEQLADNLASATWQLEPAEREVLDRESAVPLPYPHWFQRQFTAERFGKDGPPDPSSAHVYSR
jgi:aryl-alcohol dehydrogenase-like predicted oxidoreductase